MVVVVVFRHSDFVIFLDMGIWSFVISGFAGSGPAIAKALKYIGHPYQEDAQPGHVEGVGIRIKKTGEQHRKPGTQNDPNDKYVKTIHAE